MKKPRTPEQIASETERGKKAYTLYLSIKTMEYIKLRAKKAGIKPSRIVDDAISHYVESIKDKN